MTNEEAICLIGNIQFDLTDGYYQRKDYTEALCIFDRLNQENTKLKAEIERLKENYDTLAKQYSNVENSNIRYYNELKQLKSELEQSVRLQKTDEKSEKERIIIWLNDFCDKFAKCNQCIFNGRCKEFDEMDFDEIKSQYEEAEQSLKCEVSNE